MAIQNKIGLQYNGSTVHIGATIQQVGENWGLLTSSELRISYLYCCTVHYGFT
jgi:hypothetical protein